MQLDFYALAWPDASLRPDHARMIVSVRVCRQYGLGIPGILITFFIAVDLLIDSSFGFLLKDASVGQLFLPQLLLDLLGLLAIFEILFMDYFRRLYIWKELLGLFITEFFGKVHEPALFILDKLIACIV